MIRKFTARYAANGARHDKTVIIPNQAAFLPLQQSNR